MFLSAALQSEEHQGAKGGTSKKGGKSKICPIMLTNRVDEESDDEDVTIPENHVSCKLETYKFILILRNSNLLFLSFTQIYIGKWMGQPRFVLKSKLGSLGKVLFFNKRLIAVIMMVWGEEKATRYSMRGGRDSKGIMKEKVLPFHVNACYSKFYNSSLHIIYHFKRSCSCYT